VKTLLALIQTFVVVSSLTGQPMEWQRGVVVLIDERVLTGSIYNPKGFDLIFLQTKEDRIALSAGKVRLFRYYDSIANINRKFVSVKGEKGNCHFYEVIINGEVSVLREFKRFANRSHPDEIDSYNYYTYVNQTLEPIINFKNKVLPKLLEDRGEIQEFIRRERLDHYGMKSALLIIAEFNRIKQSYLHARSN